MSAPTLLSPLVVLALLALAPAARAQLSFIGPGTQVVDFDCDLGWASPERPGDDVFRHSADSTALLRPLIERESSEWQSARDRRGFSAEAWSWSRTGQDLGTGPGNRTAFGDANANGRLDDSIRFIHSFDFAQTAATFGVGSGSATDRLVRFAGHNRRENVNGPYAGFSLTLRVRNDGPAPLSQWRFGLSTWHSSTDSHFSVLRLRWSLDNTTFTDLVDFTTTRTGGLYVAQDFSQPFVAAVPPGGFLYLQLDYNPVDDGSGSALLFDNWTVTAAP